VSLMIYPLTLMMEYIKRLAQKGWCRMQRYKCLDGSALTRTSLWPKGKHVDMVS